MRKKDVLGSKYKKPKKKPVYAFSLNHFYFVVQSGEVLIYEKQNT